jgi:hypothetical protein
MLDDRELAAAVWITILIAYTLVRPRGRSALLALARAVAHPKVVLIIVSMLTVVVLLVSVATRAGLWVSEILAPTVVWVAAVGMVLVFNFENTWKTPGFLRTTARNVLGAGVFVAFFANIFPLSLGAELVLQPTIAFLMLLAVAAHRDPDQRPVAYVAEGLLLAVWFGLITFSVVQVIRQWDTLDLRLLSLEFALPVWLTVGVLPFVYAMAFYAAYEAAFVRVDRAVGCRRARVRVKLALLLVCRLHLRDLDALNLQWLQHAGGATSLSGTLQLLRRFRLTRPAVAPDQQNGRERVVPSAEVHRPDGNREQLDHREFDQTKRALRSVANCQMGWYRHRGGSYRLELSAVLDSCAELHGLPAAHGIELHVSPDGRRWWAGRRTTSGWFFAIGAAGPPPDLWEYDASIPPGGFPGLHRDWGDDPFSFAACANW